VSKSRLAKAAGAEPAGQMRDEKFYAVVARSTFPSQNVQNTSVSHHFWKLRCRKRTETSTGTPAGTKKNQQIMMEQNPCPEERKEREEEGREAPEPKKREEEGRQAPEPQPEPGGTSKS